MFLKIAIFFAASTFCFADTGQELEDVTPIEELAPKVRFLDLEENETVVFEFKEINLRGVMRAKEANLEKNYPQYFQALQKSYDDDSEWKEI